MKSVLISTKPKWCELIASNKKVIEVRKTKPKLETPFKCYIYCTKNSGYMYRVRLDENRLGIPEVWNGKVIGEFVCDRINYIGWISNPAKLDWKNHYNKDSCLTSSQLYDYSNGDCYYEWHISDLVIYEKPRELSGFFHYCGDNPKCEGCEAHYYSNTECGKEDYCCSPIEGCKPLKRPPQSWCYVESEVQG